MSRKAEAQLAYDAAATGNRPDQDDLIDLWDDILPVYEDLPASTETARGDGAVWQGKTGLFLEDSTASTPDITTAGGVKLISMRGRELKVLDILSGAPEGTLVMADGAIYVASPTKTGANSATSDVAKDGFDQFVTALPSPFHTSVLGRGAFPNPLYDTDPDPLFNGYGNTVQGSDALAAANNVSALCVILGQAAAASANRLYCCIAAGFRSLSVLADAQYVEGLGVDTFKELLYGRNSTAISSKAGLNKTSVVDSFIAGSGAAYAGGELTRCFITGNNAADGGQTEDVYTFADTYISGGFAGRYNKADFNHFQGQNAASMTEVTGSFNCCVARSGFDSLTSGQGNTATGDNAGTNVANSNNGSFYGHQVGLPPDGSAWSQCGAFGWGSGLLLTGPDQIQIGGNSQTVYAPSALTVRSDERDKIDIASIDLMTSEAIVLGADLKSYRLDPREAYIDVETGPGGDLITHHREKDGSRAGKRHHVGVLAQREKERLDNLDIDFAAIKHGAHDGQGRDVFSVQYEQYIPHLMSIVQDQARRIAELEAVLSA